jgi:hypothetical protein
MFTHLVREDFVHPPEQQATGVSDMILSLSVNRHIHPQAVQSPFPLKTVFFISLQ